MQYTGKLCHSRYQLHVPLDATGGICQSGERRMNGHLFTVAVQVLNHAINSGALDKYNILIFLYLASIECDFKLLPIPKISADSANSAFHFMRYFVNSIISRECGHEVNCIVYFIASRLWKIDQCLEILIFLQKWSIYECKTQHAVITHANTSNGYKNS